LIPPGCEHGQLLRIQIPDDMMEMASPLQNDHYFVKVLIDQSNYFVRDNLDIYTEADVSVSQALLGGKLNIRGLYEEKVIHTYLLKYAAGFYKINWEI
jgi:DnaJ-class molecular chaperone